MQGEIHPADHILKLVAGILQLKPGTFSAQPGDRILIFQQLVHIAAVKCAVKHRITTA